MWVLESRVQPRVHFVVKRRARGNAAERSKIFHQGHASNPRCSLRSTLAKKNMRLWRMGPPSAAPNCRRWKNELGFVVAIEAGYAARPVPKKVKRRAMEVVSTGSCHHVDGAGQPDFG